MVPSYILTCRRCRLFWYPNRYIQRNLLLHFTDKYCGIVHHVLGIPLCVCLDLLYLADVVSG